MVGSPSAFSIEPRSYISAHPHVYMKRSEYICCLEVVASRIPIVLSFVTKISLSHGSYETIRVISERELEVIECLRRPYTT